MQRGRISRSTVTSRTTLQFPKPRRRQPRRARRIHFPGAGCVRVSWKFHAEIFAPCDSHSTIYRELRSSAPWLHVTGRAALFWAYIHIHLERAAMACVLRLTVRFSSPEPLTQVPSNSYPFGSVFQLARLGSEKQAASQVPLSNQPSSSSRSQSCVALFAILIISRSSKSIRRWKDFLP